MQNVRLALLAAAIAVGTGALLVGCEDSYRGDGDHRQVYHDDHADGYHDSDHRNDTGYQGDRGGYHGSDSGDRDHMDSDHRN